MNEYSRITIGYSTLANRVENIIFPKVQIQHSILISVQNPHSVKFVIPDSSKQVTVVESGETGVAKSRNRVIENTTTEYLIFADDDATINPEGLVQIVEYLDSHPECDLVTAMTTNEMGALRKRYPTKSQSLTLFNSAKFGTIEMVVRVASIKSNGLRFDENFGAGSLNKLGDEYIFISDLLRIGRKGVFLPIELASHSNESSGTNLAGNESEEILAARAKVFTRVFGWRAPVVRAVFYLRRKQSGRDFSGFARFVRG